jgi:O-antigen ligase
LLATGEGILVVALLLTYSRSSFLAAIIGGCIYILLIKKWKLLLALAIFGLGIFLVPAFGGISTSAFRMWSVTARITNWQEGIQLFLQSPIIGYGFDMLRAVPRASAVSAYGYISNSAGGLDNSLLFILATTGVLGLGAFTYLWTQIVRLGLRLQKQESIKTVYFASLGALLVHSLFVNSMFYPVILVWLWICIGAIEKNITSRS